MPVMQDISIGCVFHYTHAAGSPSSQALLKCYLREALPAIVTKGLYTPEHFISLLYCSSSYLFILLINLFYSLSPH